MSDEPRTDLDVAKVEAIEAISRWYRLLIEGFAEDPSALNTFIRPADGAEILWVPADQSALIKAAQFIQDPEHAGKRLRAVPVGPAAARRVYSDIRRLNEDR